MCLKILNFLEYRDLETSVFKKWQFWYFKLLNTQHYIAPNINGSIKY